MNDRTGEVTRDPALIRKWLEQGDSVSEFDDFLARKLAAMHPPTERPPVQFRVPHDDPEPGRRPFDAGRVPGKFKVRRR